MIDLIIQALATWRLANMLVNEDGPWALFVRLRHFTGLQQTAISKNGQVEITYIATGPLAELFDCVWCMSIWVAAILSFRWLRPLRSLLAISAGAILAHEVIQWLSRQE